MTLRLKRLALDRPPPWRCPAPPSRRSRSASARSTATRRGRLPRALQAEHGAGGRGGQRRRRLARPQDRGDQPRRRRQPRRRGARGRGTADAREGRPAGRHVPVQCRPGLTDFAGRRRCSSSPPSRSPTRSSGRTATATPSACAPRPTCRSAMLMPEPSSCKKKRWARGLSELRVRPVGGGRLQGSCSRRRSPTSSSSPSRRRRSARSTPARWSQALADAKPDAIFNVAVRRRPDANSCAKATPAACSRAATWSSLLTGEPEYLDPLKDEAPVGWIVTGYPWYGINTPEHKAFLDRLPGEVQRLSAPGFGGRLLDDQVAGRGHQEGRLDRHRKAGRRLRAASSSTRRSARSPVAARPPGDPGHLRRPARAEGRQGRHDRLAVCRRRRAAERRRGEEAAAGRLSRTVPRSPPAECGDFVPASEAMPRRMTSRLLVQLLNGLAGASALFLVVGRPVADLRRHADRQLRPRLALHAGHLLAYSCRRAVGGGARLLGRHRCWRCARRSAVHRRGDRDACCCGASTARPNCSSCWPPSRSCWSSRTPRCGSGARKICWARARPGLRGAVADPRPALPALRPVADRHRAAGAGRPVAAADAHALGRAGARRHPGPRDGGRPRRRPGGCCSPRCSPLGALLAGLGGALQLPREPANLDMDLSVIADAFVVVVVGGMGSMPGAYLAAAADRRSRRCASASARCDFRRRLRVFQAHPGGGIRGDGGGAGGAAATGCWASRRRQPHVRRSKRRRRCRPAHPPRSACARAAGPRAAALLPLAGELPRRIPWCSMIDMPGCDAVRRQPAFHHGSGRHAFASATPPISASAPMAPRCWSSGSACRWMAALALGAAAGRRWARCCSAGSACGCRASISPC